MDVNIVFGILIVFASFFCKHTFGRSQGAPESACVSMMPSHGGTNTQSSAPPYTFSVVKNGSPVTQYSAGEVLTGKVII